MELLKLVITLISCEQLTSPYTNWLIRGKDNVMGIIKMPLTAQVYSTTTKQGPYPFWNENFRVEMPANAHGFDIEIRSGRDAVIGVAPIPVSDFINDLVPIGYLNFLSYRLRGQNGKFLKGIVNLSVRVIPPNGATKDKIWKGRPMFDGGKGKADGECSGSSTQYGYGGPHNHNGIGTVIGIPITYGKCSGSSS